MTVDVVGDKLNDVLVMRVVDVGHGHLLAIVRVDAPRHKVESKLMRLLWRDRDLAARMYTYVYVCICVANRSSCACFGGIVTWVSATVRTLECMEIEISAGISERLRTIAIAILCACSSQSPSW